MTKFLALLKSRKFWAAVIGVLLIALRHMLPDFPLSDDEIAKLIYIVVAFILGTGLEDATFRTVPLNS